MSPSPPGLAPEGDHPLVQGGQGAGGAVQELLPKLRQLGVPPLPLKQGHPQLLLQLPDRVAQAGLGDVQLLGGAGVVPHLGQPDKIAQVIQIHGGGLLSPSPPLGAGT